MTESQNRNSKRRAPTWWLVLLPLIVMIIIFGFSSRSQLPDLDGGRGMQDIAGHFLIYALLGATLAILGRAFGWGDRRVLFFAIAIATLYGISDEFHQSFVPHRSVEFKDVVIDFLGAAAGASAIVSWPGFHRSTNVTSDADPTQPGAGNSGRNQPMPPA